MIAKEKSFLQTEQLAYNNKLYNVFYSLLYGVYASKKQMLISKRLR